MPITTLTRAAAALLVSATASAAAPKPVSATAHPISDHPLRVAPDGRHLLRADDRPFFYLADTAWSLMHRLTREEALASYTINGAYQDHMEAVKGSIEVGKVADFCVIDQDILAIDPHQIKNTKVLKTIVNGKLVYEV